MSNYLDIIEECANNMSPNDVRTHNKNLLDLSRLLLSYRSQHSQDDVCLFGSILLIYCTYVIYVYCTYVICTVHMLIYIYIYIYMFLCVSTCDGDFLCECLHVNSLAP